MYEKKNKTLKVLVAVLSVILVMCLTVAGTLAYLQVKTEPVVNTFSPSNIDLTLVETNVDGDSDKENAYKMVPGTDISKDPKVTVVADVACYVFVVVNAENGVKLEGQSTATDYITYAVAAGWNLLDGTTNVYYQTVAADQEFEDVAVLVGNKVHVLDTVTKQMMEDAKTTVPKLTFTAYAVQQDGLTVVQAWQQAQTLAN